MFRTVVSERRADATALLVSEFSLIFISDEAVRKTAQLLHVQPGTIKRYIGRNVYKRKFDKNSSSIGAYGAKTLKIEPKLLEKIPDRIRAMETLLENGFDKEEIAKVLGIKKDSVERELRRFENRYKNR